jgi:hypothetical protein
VLPCLQNSKFLRDKDLSKWAYPADAEAHYKDLLMQTRRFRDGITVHEGPAGYRGPWVENIFYSRFGGRDLASFNGFIPLFLSWTDIHVYQFEEDAKKNKSVPTKEDAMKQVTALLRPDVVYLTVSQDDQGLFEAFMEVGAAAVVRVNERGRTVHPSFPPPTLCRVDPMSSCFPRAATATCPSRSSRWPPHCQLMPSAFPLSLLTRDPPLHPSPLAIQGEVNATVPPDRYAQDVGFFGNVRPRLSRIHILEEMKQARPLASPSISLSTRDSWHEPLLTPVQPRRLTPCYTFSPLSVPHRRARRRG